MRGYMRTALLAVMCLVGIPMAAFAQGSIAGVVKDTSGAVLPGVTVEAASPALIDKARSVVTDGAGQYNLTNLVPGVYSVTFTLTGFNSVKRDGVQVTGSFSVTVNGDMKVGAVEETITVTGETPVVDIRSTTRERVLTQEVIDAVPTSRLPFTMAVLIPGVTSRTGAGDAGTQDVGGSQGTVQSATLLVHGSHPDSLRLTYNGLTLATQETGRNAGAINNTAAYQEVAVDTSAVSAELATGGVRINLIPREGGNTFKGSFFASGMNSSMQGNNYTDDLKARGLSSPNGIKQLFDINPSFGGPIVKDRLWFFTTVRYSGDQTYAAGIFFNANASNPSAVTYVADPSRGQPHNDNTAKDGQVRLTWQATPKNKVAVSTDWQNWSMFPNGISATVAPESATETYYPLKRVIYADWSAPVTSRLLFEAVASQQDQNTFRPLQLPGIVPITEQSSGLTYRAQSGTKNQNRNSVFYWRAAVSYISGSHSLKFGINDGMGYRNNTTNDNTPLQYRFNNGVPNQITERTTPFINNANLDADLGLYAQDKWTLKRMTAALGIRFDYYKYSFPAQTVGPVPLAPTLNLAIPETPGVQGWKDLTPKMGLTYDAFGNGKTAIKVALNKYVRGVTLGATDTPAGTALNPVNRLVTQTTRSWTDTNKNFVPDCNLSNPAAQTVAGGDTCGAMANTNFGSIVPGATYDPSVLTGWGHREYNWEFSTGVQQQILPQVAVDISYFRRWFGNFIATDNLAVAPSDYTAFSITAPSNAGLPGGGGYTVGGIYDLNPAKFGVPAQNFITFADAYGNQIEHWNGVDISATARLAHGILFQGGVSTGKQTTDNCEITAKLPEMLFGAIIQNVTSSGVTPQAYCHVETPFLTQVKMLGSYQVPKVDVRLSASFQSIPGDWTQANFTVPTAQAALSLGRPLSGGAANATVNILTPATVYGERLNQLDLRFSKILKFGRTRTSINFDLYNALNANPVLTLNPNFAAFGTPTSILPARIFKIGGQVDF